MELGLIYENGQSMQYKRMGECRPEICNNACCLLCPHLINNQCSIYEERYEYCKNFPESPNDETYVSVRDVCSYKFIKVEN